MYRVEHDAAQIAVPRLPSVQPQSRRVAALNRTLDVAWGAGILPRPSLEDGRLLKAAGGVDADDPLAWREPLSLLLDDLDQTAALNPLGRTIAHGQIVKVLRERRRAHALWRQHPGILERPIRAPVIVLGPMRSGTTRIQRLLACDPRFAHTRMFESASPVPLTVSRRWPDGRRLRAGAGLALLHFLNPALAAIHPTGARQPEEEFGLYNFSFGPAQFEAQWRVPRFAAWWELADTRPLYREFRRLLQTIGWHRGEDPERPWLLKAPQFMQDLGVMLEMFPDARLLCLERGLAEVIPSSASLVWNQMRLQSDRADKAWIGREWLRKTRLRNARAAAARRSNPDVPQLDISFAAVNRDWRSEVRRIYAFLELDLPDEVERKMEAYVAGARTHLGHRYSAAEFGLSAEAIAS